MGKPKDVYDDSYDDYAEPSQRGNVPLGGDGFADDYGMDGSEDSHSWSPQQGLQDPGSNTFKQRNNPEDLIKRFKLQLLCAFEKEVKIKDVNGEERTTFKTVFKKNTLPVATKQGVEDIISYLEKFINNHSVQSNFKNLDDFNHAMKHISDDIVIHLLANRKKWGVAYSDCDILISNFTNEVDLFLRRALEDKERGHYGESYREHTQRSIQAESKANIFQKFGQMLGGQRNR